MLWWENNKHILVRERIRIDNQYSDNDFTFEIRNSSLWVVGTLLNFFEFECKYPDAYPYAPPDIFPKDRSTNWVPKHQYVKDGRFCLNIREKTWNSTLSAADVIKSLETLLLAEGIRKIKKEKTLILYEEDELTKLQRSFKDIKCIIPSDISFPFGESIGLLKTFYHIVDKDYRIIVSVISPDGKNIGSNLVKKIWKFKSYLEKTNGIWIKSSLKNIIKILYTETPVELLKLLREQEIISETTAFRDIVGDISDIHVLLFDEKYSSFYFYMEIDLKNNKNEPFGTYLLNSQEIFDRVPSTDIQNIIEKKKVTIIGCGSGGSKISEYLVKAGIKRLVLIDGDILSTQNIVRHLCQLDDVGMAKVYAVANKLRKINPEVEIKSIHDYISVINSPINEQIKDSDLIIVATALNEEVFNEYSYSKGIPAIYAKVYPLGFGGEIFRIIPKVTPCFECAHYLKESFIQEYYASAVFPDYNTMSYDQTIEGQQIGIPSLAVDADFISLISSQMAIELLIENNYQYFKDFPNVILWGNKKEWIFDQPFQCIKIYNKHIRSLKKCIVCNGDSVIEKELGMSNKQVDEKYKNIFSKIGIKNDNKEKSGI